MKQKLIIVRVKAQSAWYRIKQELNKWAYKATVITLMLVIVFGDKINITFGEVAKVLSTNKLWWEDIRDHASLAGLDDLNLANEATATSDALTPAQKKQAAGYSNLGFILNPDVIIKNKIPTEVVAYKKAKVYGYIDKYLEVSKQEANLYNIPVSIILAQALLESNAGDSKLASKENNHFGIKCNANSGNAPCANYTDDSPHDMFRVFETAWFSFREHSKLLTGKRYKHLLELPRTDYKNWAHGLKAAGYATDKTYGVRLIEIIEALNLSKYDV